MNRLVFALTLLLNGAALAQQVPNPQPRNTVNDHGALLTASTATYPQGLWRLSFSPPDRPAPPQFYRPSNAACPLFGGDGDYGSEVKSADGKCWLAVFGAEGADIRQWGVAFDGVVESTISFNRAVTWAATKGETLILPAGTGNALVDGAAATIPNGKSLKIAGAGVDSSVIQVTGAIGLNLTYGGRASSIAFRDFALCDPTANTGKTAIRLSSPGIPKPADAAINELNHITIRGCAGLGGTQGFTTGVDVNQVSNVNFNGITVQGPMPLGGGFPLAGTTGVKITSTPPDISVSFNFHGANISYNNVGVSASANTQGVTISQSNFVVNNRSVVVPNASGTAEFTIQASAFECVVTCLSLDASIVNIYGNIFIMDVSNGVAMHFPTANDVLVSHNHIVQYFSNTGLVGIKIDAVGVGSMVGILRGNQFVGMDKGIQVVSAGDYALRILDNHYGGGTPIALGAGARILELSDSYIPFANVIPCGLVTLGARTRISDSTVNTWGAYVTVGGGSNLVGAICNGTGYSIYAK